MRYESAKTTRGDALPFWKSYGPTVLAMAEHRAGL